MSKSCIGNCILCGKCSNFSIRSDVIVSSGSEKRRGGYGLAVDIGTTSVIMVLVNLSAGKIIARHSFFNPQRKFGPDVISRINAANNGAPGELNQVITQALATGLNVLLKESKIDGIVEAVISGNTVMTYLLLGLPLNSLGTFPFIPAYRLREKYKLSEIISETPYDCPVYVFPWFSAFVGGDISSGILNVLALEKKRFLLIDLGTNGEMALYKNGCLFVTSTAAGPAFEGAGHCGGASAAIDDLALALDKGYLDDSGLIMEGSFSIFTQKEIRDLQLAKSAVRAGLHILLDAAKICMREIDSVFLAGGIGQALNIDNSVRIGLLPAELKTKVFAAGNTSLGGAVLRLLQPEVSVDEVKKMLASSVDINLAEHPRFNDLFMEFINFS